MSFAPKRGAPTSPAHAPRRTLGTALPVTALAGSDSAPISDASDHAFTAMEPYHYGGGIAPPRGAAAMSPATTPAESISRTSLASAAPPRPAGGHALPAPLRHGIERLSGLAMDDVGVHFDSPEPARLGALAYARGAEIHLAPGQARHLPHEAWHVVQQKQGRVAATTQLKDATSLNDDSTLEREADTMGRRAAALGADGHPSGPAEARPVPRPPGPPVVQRFVDAQTAWTIAVTAITSIGLLAYGYSRWNAGRSGKPANKEPRHDAGASSQPTPKKTATPPKASAEIKAPPSFDQLGNWSADNRAALQSAFDRNANGLKIENWIRIADKLGPVLPAEVESFCQIEGWTWSSINELVSKFTDEAQNPNHLSAAQWSAVATRVERNKAAQVSALCGIQGWSWAEIDALATACHANQKSLRPAELARVAEATPAGARAQLVPFMLAAQQHRPQDKGKQATTPERILALAAAGGRRFVPLVAVLNAGERYPMEDLTRIVTTAAPQDDQSVSDIAAVLTTVTQHHPDATATNIVDLLLPIGAGWGVVADAGRLVTALAGRGSLTDLSSLAAYARQHYAGSSAADLTALITQAQTNYADTQMQLIRQLLTEARALGSLAELTTLLQRVHAHRPGTSLANARLLVLRTSENGAGGTLAQLTTLVDTVGARDTIEQLAGLVRIARLAPLAASITDITALVALLPGLLTVSTDLRALLTAINGRGTVQEINDLITAGVNKLGVAHIMELRPLILRSPAHNTPANVRGLLNAIQPANSLTRFRDIFGWLPLFRREAAPDSPRIDYSATGHPIAGVGGGVFHCDAWRYFRRRHTFRYFDFTIADNLNSIWPDNVNLQDQLAYTLPLAIPLGLQPNHNNAAFDHAQPNNAHNHVAVNAPPNGMIVHLRPAAATAVAKLSLAEATAIGHLR
ncbi:eCIS core domain-containing protein [Burkholderia gladioli]|jgi:hypothetical protein|uniref:eCIS core domain-containing protein n=1 Tax=Burkholderia gladioli TaxID=28095 RepID=UPI001641065A|nr:DUF4157 domain-containing protein [Burkholderia gladioli]